MDLRYYQNDAIRAVLSTLSNRKDVNPCIEIPTGGGKTPIIATLCKVFSDSGYRTLVVAHRKELLEQTIEKLKVWAPNATYGLVSAGLGRKDYNGEIVVAGIQSVYRNVDKLNDAGKIDFVIIDEAHLIPADDENENGMYQTLLQGLRAYNPALSVVGLTATPYRLSSGSVCGEGKILSEITYKVDVKELISAGYLSKLTTKAPPIETERTDFHIKHGEFDSQEVEETFNNDRVVFDACQSIAKICANRKSVLIFCCSVEHCKNVAKQLAKLTNDEIGVVTGIIKKDVRATYLRRFKRELQTDLTGTLESPLKYLCNIDVLTTGFDATNVDCVVLLRPTASPGLYYQMCGRGFRIDSNKQDCLILDYAGNIKRFGAIDQLQPPQEHKHSKFDTPKSKTCPICFECVDVHARLCPNCGCKLTCDDFLCPNCSAYNDRSNMYCCQCGYQLRQIPHDSNPDGEHDVISSSGDRPIIEENVVLTSFDCYKSRKSGINMLRATYMTPTSSLCEFVCFDHDGYARHKACEWFKTRFNCDFVPTTSAQAREIVEYFQAGRATRIKYLPRRNQSEYNKIIDVELDHKVTPIGRYPRVDNPLNIKCQDCGFDSFLYERNGKYYYIKCAKCESTIFEISPETNVDDDERKAEIQSIKRLGIAFYDPNSGIFDDDENEEDDYQELTQDELDDIPF